MERLFRRWRKRWVKRRHALRVGSIDLHSRRPAQYLDGQHYAENTFFARYDSFEASQWTARDSHNISILQERMRRDSQRAFHSPPDRGDLLVGNNGRRPSSAENRMNSGSAQNLEPPRRLVHEEDVSREKGQCNLFFSVAPAAYGVVHW